MKKEIKRNEFYTNSNIINELKIKKENKFLKRIGTEFKNSINKNALYKNIINSVISKKSKKNFIDELNMINLNESLDDVLSSVLLNQNKNNFELLNQSIEHKPEKENNREYIYSLDNLVFFITFYYLIYNPYYFSSYAKINSPDEFTFNDRIPIYIFLK